MTVAADSVVLPVGVASNTSVFSAGCGCKIEYKDVPDYTGGYSFTPSAEEQIIPTKDTALSENIVIAPIPDNYGLITWDGSVITVS